MKDKFPQEALIYMFKKAFLAFADANELKIISACLVLTVAEQEDLVELHDEDADYNEINDEEYIPTESIAQVVIYIPSDQFTHIVEH